MCLKKYLQYAEITQCQITGRYSRDLAQGDLEVPCILTDVNKATKLIEDIEKSESHTKVDKMLKI